MKKFKRMLLLGLCGLCLATCGACTKEPQEDVTVQLNETAVELKVGETVALEVSVSPSDVMDKTILWKSMDEKIAVVSDGVITGKAEGSTEVTATSNGKSASCRVTVTK